jgi:glycosyltransferase involved in cell wall biosynthesis
MVVNCREGRWIDGVHYLPLSDVKSIQADVLIMNTSGGDLDLSPALDLDIEARLRIVWVHGAARPTGLDQVKPDYIYAVSNYIAGVVRDEWDVPEAEIFVSFNGYDSELFTKDVTDSIERDPFKLVYCSHPSKGLESAEQTTRLLFEKDERYHLDVYGGYALWGGDNAPSVYGDGIIDHGLVDQSTLIRRLHEASISFHLQSRQEPFGLSALEAMRAGCIVLASYVGAFPEFIHHGKNGFLVEGDSADPTTHKAAAELILRMSKEPEYIVDMRREAKSIPWSSNRIATLWESHWHITLS